MISDPNSHLGPKETCQGCGRKYRPINPVHKCYDCRYERATGRRLPPPPQDVSLERAA